MNYPPAVRALVERLKKYTPDAALRTCDVVHIYPGPLAYPNGHYDSRVFRLVIYNQSENKVREISRADGITMAGAEVAAVRIFADGSTMITFASLTTIEIVGGDVYFH